MELADLDVLVVDDHEAMRMLLTRAFARAGVGQVRAAASGQDALAALRARPAALILVDQNMPGMDGTALIAAVRGEAVFGTPRIIMISGTASSEHTAQARAAGADAVLTKPVTLADLLAAINTLFAI
jgi:CheY-like chemotaxis protein